MDRCPLRSRCSGDDRECDTDAAVHARWHRLVPCSGRRHFSAGHERMYRHRDRLDDSSGLWCSPSRARWQERLGCVGGWTRRTMARSEEHTSELQSLTNLVCRLLLEKKKKDKIKE